MNNTHGGKRIGAGRKPDPDSKIAVTKKLDREIVAYLQTCENATEVIESLIKNSEAFIAWTKSKSDADRAKKRELTKRRISSWKRF